MFSNMKDKVLDFLLNKALGRVAVRVAASTAMYAASGSLGFSLSLDPNELAAAMITGANALISLLKPRKAAPAPEAPKP